MILKENSACTGSPGPMLGLPRYGTSMFVARSSPRETGEQRKGLR